MRGSSGWKLVALVLVGTVAAAACSQIPPQGPPLGELIESADPVASPSDEPKARHKIVGRTVTYAIRDGERLGLDVFHVPALAPQPVLVVMHGGIWRRRVKRIWARHVPRLVRAGYVVVMPDVRLAPPGGTSRFPASVDDLSDVVGWLRDHAARIGGDPDRIGTIGSSSGAHLVLMAAGTGRGRPDAVASLSPSIDLSDLHARNLIRSGIEAYLGCLPHECPDRYRAASPVYAMDGRTPPTLLVHGAREAIPRSHFVRLARRLEELGVRHRRLELDEDVHGLKLAPVALGPIIRFMNERL